MKLLRILAFFYLVLNCMVGFTYAQPIAVSLPVDATGEQGTSVTIPIMVGDMTNRNVLSYQAIVLFDENILDATGASNEGTLSEPFGAPMTNISVGGQIIVRNFGSTPLSGSGTLINLQFDVVGSPGGTTDLEFVGFLFNTGDPPATFTNGKFTVSVPQVPNFGIAPSSHDFGDVIVGTTVTQDFVVTNTGTADLQVSSSALTGPNLDQFKIDSGSAPFTLVPGDSQKLVVSFIPGSVGIKNALLEIVSNDPDEAVLTVNLTGKGVLAPRPILSLSLTSHDFGDVTLNSSASQVFVIFNDGMLDVDVTETNLAGADANQFNVERGAPFTLSPGDSQNLEVSFKPTSFGLKHAELQILTNVPNLDTLKIALTGNSVAATIPDIQVSPASHNFGDVIIDSTFSQKFVISNKGTAELMVSATTLTGIDSSQFGIVSGVAPFNLAPGDSQILVVSFTPGSVGIKSAFLNIISNDPDEPTVTMSLTGNGVPRPEPDIFVTPDSHFFGNIAVDSTASQSFNVVNTGTADLIVNATTLAGADFDQFAISSGAAPFTLVPGDSQPLVISFTPDSEGAKNAVLQISSNDADADTLRIDLTGNGIGLLEMTINIITPEDREVICADSVIVKGIIHFKGGLPPFAISCDVNGFQSSVSDTLFMSTVPVVFGENLLVAACSVIDSQGNKAATRDSVVVVHFPPPVCEVEIIAPQESAVFCTDSVKVVAVIHILSGTFPIIRSCEINGIETEIVDSLFTATVALSSGENTIIATCTIEDSCGNMTVCSDTITVFYDDIPPTCNLTHEGASVIGTFFDEHSGIAQILPVKLKNAKLTVESFSPGAKRVDFRIDPIDPNKPRGFSIDVIDMCGNTFNCDPVFLNLPADRSQRQFEFTFLKIDRYLQLDNYGLTEIHVELNGHKFSFFSDPDRAKMEFNAFFMPEEGKLSIDLIEYLREGENKISITYEGPSGSYANLFLLDFLPDVEWILELEKLPDEFQLAQNYPNPFNPITNISFSIPAKQSAGVEVKLQIFNILGKVIRNLVNEHKRPGRYTVQWDSRDQNGVTVSSGLYLYQLQVDGFRQTRRMILLK